VGGCCCCRWLSCPRSCCAVLLECGRAPASRARMGAAAATAAAITSRPEKGLAPLCSPHIEALASNAAAEPASLPPAPLARCAGLCCACQTPRAPPQPSWQARRVAQCQWQVRSVVCGLQSGLCRACQAHPTPPPRVQQLALSRGAGGAWQVTMRHSTVFISALPPPHAVPLPSTPLPPPTYPLARLPTRPGKRLPACSHQLHHFRSLHARPDGHSSCAGAVDSGECPSSPQHQLSRLPQLLPCPAAAALTRMLHLLLVPSPLLQGGLPSRQSTHCLPLPVYATACVTCTAGVHWQRLCALPGQQECRVLGRPRQGGRSGGGGGSSRGGFSRRGRRCSRNRGSSRGSCEG
jgi:hypothetical protein